MDLALLPHLSDDAIAAEAAARGVAVEGLDRAAAIDAIRAHAVGETAAPEREDAPESDEAEGEPIATRTMAEVYLAQGALERARVVVEALRDAGDDVGDLETRVAEAEALLSLREAADRRLSVGGTFLEVVSDGRRHLIAWSLDDAGAAQAEALLGASGEPTLRVVRIGADGRGYVRTKVDERTVERRGHAPQAAEAGDRLVVAVGLRAGERFAAASHISWSPG